MSQITDGTGQGYTAKVNSDNQLSVSAATQSVEHYNNYEKGRAWHLLLERTPTAAADNFLYIKNSGTRSLIVEGFFYRTASAEQIKVFLDTSGTPASGTTLEPVTVNTSSAETITGTIESGNDITGLTDGRQIEHLFLNSQTTSYHNFEMDVIIAPGGTMSMQAVTGGVQLNMTIPVYTTEI